MSNVITLLTDFGTDDHYVSVMKGVILFINKDARIIDISHSSGSFSTDEASYQIFVSFRYFPKNTIHVIVVDPGVGSDRIILGYKTENYTFIAPDNGVLKFIFNNTEGEAFSITNKEYYLTEYISNTFHGRDIFASVAAYLSKGIDLGKMGNKIYNFDKGKLPELHKSKNMIEGEIIYIDKFGNAITNINKSLIESKNITNISVRNLTNINMNQTFSNVKQGEILAYIGSSDFLEIAINKDNFAEIHKIRIGDKVKIKF